MKQSNEQVLGKKEIVIVLDKLSQTYPDAHCELNFTSPFELLLATMLSAQSTDKRVNIVTEKLFSQVREPEDILQLGQEGLENAIKELGLYRNKAKNIYATCEIIVREYTGEVPTTLKTLVALPGVGRKTANVVLANAFGIPTMAVDTHVFRVANRIGLVAADSVDAVEKQLMEKIPREKWIDAHHWLIWHGRRICNARSPKCGECPLKQECRYFALSEK